MEWTSARLLDTWKLTAKKRVVKLRRVLPEAEFTRWLGDACRSLPTDGRGDWLARRGDRPHRSQAWASLRTEPLEGADD
jgi:hypothetical protein